MLAVRCSTARSALGMGVRDQAEVARVSPGAPARGEPLKERAVNPIRDAFETAGVEFISGSGGGAGLRPRKRT